MYSSAFLAFTALVLCLLITPLVRRAAVRLNIVDRPDFDRKLHSVPVARIGGVAVAVSYVAAFGLLLLLPLRATNLISENLHVVARVLPAALIIFMTGLLDDIVSLSARNKLGLQIVAAMVAYWCGVRVLGVAGYDMQGWWSFFVTVFWLILCTNAFNLIDGLDGLAAGVGFLSALTMMLAAILNGDVALCLATAPLAGCLLGFLRYNFNPASIYLGDSGSLLLGFLLGCFGVVWSYKSATLLGMLAPLMTTAIPLADTSLTVIRRFVRNRPLFRPDRGHLHHLLLERGLTPRRAACVLYLLAGLAAAFALAQYTASPSYALLILVTFCGVALAAVNKLGLTELRVVQEALSSGSIRQIFDAEVNLRRIRESLAQAESVDECWRVIEEGSRDFGLEAVRLEIAGRVLEPHLTNRYTTRDWILRVPIGGAGLLEFLHMSSRRGPDLSGSFVDIVQRELNVKARLQQSAMKASVAK
jgi:UDP-GlcNAc:undecaprenyl-phosphate GlcNAc-1-phosphate transferase